MKFYSDVTKKLYDTVEDLEAAEKEVELKELKKQELAKQKAARIAEIEAAQKAHADLCDKFIEDYGMNEFLKFVSKELNSTLEGHFKENDVFKAIADMLK